MIFKISLHNMTQSFCMLVNKDILKLNTYICIRKKVVFDTFERAETTYDI